MKRKGLSLRASASLRMMRVTGLILGLMILASAVPAIGQTAEKGLPPGAPDFSKMFAPDTIGPGSTTTLTFTIDLSDDPMPVSALAFSDTLPAGMTIADPSGVFTDCPNAVLSAPAGGTTITLSDGDLGAFQTCIVRVNVTASMDGTNTSGALTSSAGSSGTATDMLTVDAARPGFSKGFSPSTIPAGGTSTLTFTIDNTANGSVEDFLSFSDNLPAGVVVAAVPDATSDCGTPPFVLPSITANPGSGTISVTVFGTMAFPAVAAGASCTVEVDVTAPGNGAFDNVSGELNLSGGPTSGFATDTLNVPIDFINKVFTDDPVSPGGTVTLQFTIQNPDRTFPATGISFDDDLDSVISGLAPTGMLPATPCGAGSSLSFAAGILSLSGGDLAPEGMCTFSVTLLVPAGTAGGAFGNTTTAVTATIDGENVTGNMASDTLFVTEAPVLTKEFTDDPVGPGGTVNLQFTITNVSTSTANNIAFTDNLSAVTNGLTPTGTPFVDPCSGATVTAFVSLDDLFLDVSGGTLAPAGMTGDSCTIDVSLSVPVGAPAGTFPNTTSAITADLQGGQPPPKGGLPPVPVVGPGASDDLIIVGTPLLSKEFTDDPVAPGGTVTLQFTLEHDSLAAADAMDVAFTDDLTALMPAVPGLLATVASTTCTGAGVDLSTPTLIDVSGGVLMPGETCTVDVTLSVPGGAAPGTRLNTTSDVTATVGGVAATGSPAQDQLRIAGLMLIKEFTDDPAIPGDTVNLRFTLDNTSGVADATSILFTDNLDAALTGLAAVAPLPVAPCGGTISGTNFLIFSGGSVLAGASCFFDVTVMVPAMAANGDYLNVTSNLSATIGGTPLVLDPAADVLVVDDELLAIGKSFTDDPATPGGTVTLEFTIDNLDLNRAASAIAFSDDLDAALSGLTVGMAIGNTCGGTPAGAGTGTFSYSGGSLPAGGTCTIAVDLNVPPGPLPGNLFTNTTSTVTGTINGFPVSGPAASDDLRVVTLLLDKTFGGVGFPGETVDLTFTVTNLDSNTGASNLSFSDSLPGGLSAVAPLPTNPCGAGSTIAGTTFLTVSGASLGAGGMCSFPVTVLVPAGASPGMLVNTTSDLFSSGLPVGGPGSDTLTIEPPPTFAKSFSPASIGIGQTSTLSFSIDNGASTVAASSLDFTDNLPAGIEVAAPPAVSNGCGGSVTANAGATTISLGAGTVGAGMNCVVSVNVTGTMSGAPVNTTGDLTSSSGNSGTASDTLTVNPQPGFAKVFAPNPVATGGISTLTFTVDNTASTVDATGLGFSDTLPAGVIIATPANAATTCGGTLVALSNSGTIDFTGGTAGAGASCTVTADVTSATAGTYANTSGNLTSNLGDSGPASDTLTVFAVPAFGKAFAPNPIVAGAVSTLTFTIDNSANVLDATGLDFSDPLPAAVTIATPANASTDCTGGTLTAPDGGGTIGYTGGTLAAGASCTVDVDVTSATPGSHLNTSGNLTSSLGNSGPAADTLIVNAGPVPAFSKTFAPNTVAQGAGSTLTFTIDNAGSLVDAGGLDFTDPLPAGLVIATPSNAGTTCGGGTLTAPDGGGTIGYTGGTLAAGASCTLTVDVSAQAAGGLVNTSGDLTSSLGNSGPASDTLTVTAAPVPGFAKVFAPASIGFGGVSTLTFTIDNSGSLVGATGLDFTDNLPAAVTLATPANAATDCTGGALTAPDGGGTIGYTGGTVAAGATCTVSADVTSMTAGSYVNTSGDLTSSLGNSGPASDTLVVAGNDLTLTKAFLSDPVLPGGTVDVEFQITNVSASFDATGITFMDDLNGAIPGMSAVGLPVSACGGTVTGASGDTVLTFAGGTLAAGASCTVTVTLRVPASAAPGTYTNTTGPISGTFAGMAKGNGPVPGAPASASFTVAYLSFSKVFAGGATVGGIATLNFIISNPDPANTATAIGFSDDLNAFIPGAAAIMLPQNDVCGAGSSLTGTSVITLAGGTLGPSALCTFQVRIQLPDSVVPGPYTNVTGPLAATVGGAPVTGAGAVTASAVLGVGAVTPVPTLSTWSLLALIGLLLLVSARRLRAER